MKNFLNIDVEDSGCGIPLNSQLKVFEPFSQGDNSTTRIYGGTGLGLNLSKLLTKAMGGDFMLKESVVGVGTTFSISIPFDKLPKTEMISCTEFPNVTREDKSSDQKTLSPARVLIVEDAVENQRLLKILLESWGVTTQVASNGSEGVESALNGDFDMVLMDIQMPIMDGYEATSILRQTGYHKPVIALTAHAMKEEKDKCIASGFSDFLTKPIDQASLYGLISSSFNPSQNVM